MDNDTTKPLSFKELKERLQKLSEDCDKTGKLMEELGKILTLTGVIRKDDEWNDFVNGINDASYFLFDRYNSLLSKLELREDENETASFLSDFDRDLIWQQVSVECCEMQEDFVFGNERLRAGYAYLHNTGKVNVYVYVPSKIHFSIDSDGLVWVSTEMPPKAYGRIAEQIKWEVDKIVPP